MPHIIHRPWPNPTSSRKQVAVQADRLNLSKRRWQTAAADGVEFGFDVESHLHHGDVIFEDENVQYVLVQKPEPVLIVPLGEPVAAAHTAWSLGNLHFPIEVRAGSICVVDDPAVRLCLEREHIAYKAVTDVFHPIKIISSHHDHGHAH